VVVTHLLPLVLLHPLPPLLVLLHLLLSQLTHQLPWYLLLPLVFNILCNYPLPEWLLYLLPCHLLQPLPLPLSLHKFPPPFPFLLPLIDVIHTQIIVVIDEIGKVHPDMIISGVFDYLSVTLHLHLLLPLDLSPLQHLNLVQLPQPVFLPPALRDSTASSGVI